MIWGRGGLVQTAWRYSLVVAWSVAPLGPGPLSRQLQLLKGAEKHHWDIIWASYIVGIFRPPALNREQPASEGLLWVLWPHWSEGKPHVIKSNTGFLSVLDAEGGRNSGESSENEGTILQRSLSQGFQSFHELSMQYSWLYWPGDLCSDSWLLAVLWNERKASCLQDSAVDLTPTRRVQTLSGSRHPNPWVFESLFSESKMVRAQARTPAKVQASQPSYIGLVGKSQFVHLWSASLRLTAYVHLLSNYGL